MSEDVIRPLMKAVADLPKRYTGLLLETAKTLRGPRGEEVAPRLQEALKPVEVTEEDKKQQHSLVTLVAPVHRSREPREAIVATGRVLHLDEAVVLELPLLASSDTLSMNCYQSFYRLDRHIACDELDGELAKHNFELVVDPVGLTAINQAFPELADHFPNATQGRSASGEFWFMVFDYWSGERHVSVKKNDQGWFGLWWVPVRPLPQEA